MNMVVHEPTIKKPTNPGPSKWLKMLYCIIVLDNIIYI